MRKSGTIWVCVTGVFVTVFMFVFLNYLVIHSITFVRALVATFFLVCLYGSLFWVGFILSLLVLDVLLRIPGLRNLGLKLFIEWVAISTVVIYFAVIYKEQRPVLLVSVISFLILQFIRARMILKGART